MSERQTPTQSVVSNFVVSACDVAYRWRMDGQLTEAIDFFDYVDHNCANKIFFQSGSGHAMGEPW